MSAHKNSAIHLRPRFKMNFNESKEALVQKFRDNLKDVNCKYCSKIIDGHIVIDIPVDENHFWSPQLNIEIEKLDDHTAVVKGLFGPKPQVWTLFMFIHFAVAFAFTAFSIMAYVKWTLKTDYTFALTVTIILPVIWVILYFLGQMGKKTGHQQMDDLYVFMMETLER